MPERSTFYDKLDFLGFTALRNELAALGSRKLLLTPGLRLPLNIVERTQMVGSARLLDPTFHRSVGLKAIE